ncbi:MAG: transglycosylase SLT domain-containing protein [Cypionkella sp.]|jgi:hypothetical protein|nr:transglycosylase SLT domain-containing protein [Cypionkella sp.]
MRFFRAVLLAVAVLSGLPLTLVGPAQARMSREIADQCDAAALAASRATGVPDAVLRAISRVETGRSVDGQLAPWPWTVNQAGDGSFFASVDDAMDHVAAAMAEGQRNIDVGCYQINIRWHGEEFASLANMFEPTENALYAARFLLRLYDEFGTWEGAIGAYHSRQAAAAEAYVAKVASHLSGPVEAGAPILIAADTPRDNSYPLFRQGATRGHGSLVSTDFDSPVLPLFR